MKRFISAIALSAILMSSNTSNALVGLVLSSRTTAITGGAIAGLGGVGIGVYAAGLLGPKSLMDLAITAIVLGYPGIVLAGIGIVVLEDENQSVKYQALAYDDTTKTLGITPAEAVAFNNEIDTIVSLHDENTAQAIALQAQMKKGKMSESAISERIMKNSENFWKSNKDVLSHDAQSALLKINMGFQSAAQN